MIAKPLERTVPTPGNPRGYPPFDMQLIPSYANNQITHYFTSGAIPAAELPRFQQLMQQRKAALDTIGWGGASDDENASRNPPEESEILENSDSDYLFPPAGFRDIKVSAADIICWNR